jgi:hypothetical protein
VFADAFLELLKNFTIMKIFSTVFVNLKLKISPVQKPKRANRISFLFFESLSSDSSVVVVVVVVVVALCC